MKDRKMILPETWINEHVQTAKINVIFKDGNFVDTETSEKIDLLDGVRFMLTVPLDLLSPAQKKIHQQETKTLFFESGTNLDFNIKFENKVHTFTVTLEEDLMIRSKGNKLGTLDNCKCMVTDVDGALAPILADSLNQAFTKTSVALRPQNKTHTCNVFKTFSVDGRSIDYYRNNR